MTVSSSSARPMPPTVPPMIWLRASFSLRMRPAVDGRHDRATRSSPEVRVDADLDELRRERAAGGGHRPSAPRVLAVGVSSSARS